MSAATSMSCAPRGAVNPPTAAPRGAVKAPPAPPPFALEYDRIAAAGHTWKRLNGWFRQELVCCAGEKEYDAVANGAWRGYAAAFIATSMGETRVAVRLGTVAKNVERWRLSAKRSPCPLELRPDIARIAQTMVDAGYSHRRALVSWTAGLALAARAWCVRKHYRLDCADELLGGGRGWCVLQIQRWQKERGLWQAPLAANAVEAAILEAAERAKREGIALAGRSIV